MKNSPGWSYYLRIAKSFVPHDPACVKAHQAVPTPPHSYEDLVKLKFFSLIDQFQDSFLKL